MLADRVAPIRVRTAADASGTAAWTSPTGAKEVFAAVAAAAAVGRGYGLGAAAASGGPGLVASNRMRPAGTGPWRHRRRSRSHYVRGCQRAWGLPSSQCPPVAPGNIVSPPPIRL